MPTVDAQQLDARRLQERLIRVGDPPMENITWLPDKDMISLSASVWW
jgi:hypothetical protein